MPFSQIIIKKNCGKKEKETIGAEGDVLCFHNIANHELLLITHNVATYKSRTLI